MKRTGINNDDWYDDRYVDHKYIFQKKMHEGAEKHIEMQQARGVQFLPKTNDEIMNEHFQKISSAKEYFTEMVSEKTATENEIELTRLALEYFIASKDMKRTRKVTHGK